MDTVLLTGSSGFIGQQVLRQLAHNQVKIHCFNRRKGIFQHPNIIYHEVDLLKVNHQSLSLLLEKIKPTLCIHCAWYTNHKDYLVAEINREWLTSSKILINEFFRSGGTRFIGLGTCIEYDPPEGEKCNELTTPLRPQTLYSQCKLELAQYLASISYKSDQSYAWTRIFFVYGPNDRAGRLIPYIYNQLLKGEKATPRHGALKRDYIYIDDLAAQIVKIAFSEVKGTINTGTGQGQSIQDIFNTVGFIMELDHLIDQNQIYHPDEPKLICADMTRYLSYLGESECRDFLQGVRQTISSFQKVMN